MSVTSPQARGRLSRVFLPTRFRAPDSAFVAELARRVLARDAVWIGLGLLIAVAVAWRVVATPGELVRWDAGYPFAGEFWTRWFTNAWDTSSGSTLVTMVRTYVDAPWGFVVQVLGLSSESAGKLHWLSWHLLGFLAGYVGARLMVGPEMRAAHPVAVRAGLVLAGLFWAINPWSLGRWGQLYVHVSAMVLPLVVGLAVSAARSSSRRGRVRHALAAAAALAFVGSVSPHYMAIGVLSGIGWFVYTTVMARDRRRPLMITAAVFIGGYAVLAAFFLVPYVVATIGGSATSPTYLSGIGKLSAVHPFLSFSNTLALTGHEAWDSLFRPSTPSALAGWRMASFVPVALLALALLRLPSHRLLLGYSAILCGLTALFQIATYAEATRPAYLDIVVNAPFGWALRSPDRLTGALALAYLPGIALAPVMFTRHAPRTVPGLGAIQTAAVGLALAIYMLPSVQWALLDERAQHVPERFPASFHTVPAELDRRNADWASRTLLAIWDQRLPEWSSQGRVLPLIERISVLTPYAVSNLPVGDRLVALLEDGASNVSDVLRTHGVARVLVATDTTRGQAVAHRLRMTDGLELEIAGDAHEVFRTVVPPYPWVYEQGRAGPAELPWRREGMHRLVIDVPPGSDEPREIVTQEYWDPLWTAQLPNHEAAVKRSELGLLSVRLGPGASGTLVLEYGLQRALIVGHAITWAGLLAWAVWSAWPKLPRRPRAYP